MQQYAVKAIHVSHLCGVSYIKTQMRENIKGLFPQGYYIWFHEKLGDVSTRRSAGWINPHICNWVIPWSEPVV